MQENQGWFFKMVRPSLVFGMKRLTMKEKRIEVQKWREQQQCLDLHQDVISVYFILFFPLVWW